MSILKKQNVGNDKLMEFMFILLYHINLLQSSEKKSSLKNYWLQKKETKDQVKEHNAKLDEIARFVTKYINNRKSSK